MLLGYAGSDDSKVVGVYDSHTIHELLIWHRSEKGKDEDFLSSDTRCKGRHQETHGPCV